MRRRAFLQRIAVGGVSALCPACLVAARRALAAVGDPWSYSGGAGPERWGRLSADFKTCALGRAQSPVDLAGAEEATEPDDISVSYAEMPLRLLNTGHTIEVNCEPGSYVELAEGSFELRQFHFHRPSEHLLAGRLFDMEIHFVHAAADGRLAVLAVFVTPGERNAALRPIWKAMPKKPGPELSVAEVTVAPIDLLPSETRYIRYSGSLTTPPCSEGVIWTVFVSPIEASAAQIARFARLYASNARPVQPLNRRKLLVFP